MNEKIMEAKKETDEISLKQLVFKLQDWYRYLLSKWVLIFVFGLLGGGLGLAYAWSKKPIYTATTTFVLEESDKGGGLGQYAGLASMVGIDIGGGGGGIFQGDNILELYTSRKMIEMTLNKKIKYDGKEHKLIDRFIQFNQLRKGWDSKPELKNLTFDHIDSLPPILQRLTDSVIGSIANDVKRGYLSVTKLDKQLSIVKVEVKSSDELFAKSFNEEIVKNVNDFYVQTKTKKSLENVAILQQKTDSVRSVMYGAIYSAAAVTDATPNLNPSRQVQRTAPVQRSQFSAETNKVILGELVKNLELSKISLKKEEPLIQVIDQPIFPLEKEKTGKAKGLIFGGIFGGFMAALFLLLKKIMKGIMA